MLDVPNTDSTTPQPTPAKPTLRLSPQYPDDLATILPAELIAAARWIVWRLELDGDGDWTKVPYNPRTGRGRASSTNLKTWGTFAQAVARMRADGFDGLGFMLGDGFVGVDLDHCIDTATGEILLVSAKGVTLDAAKIVERFATYTEVSPSGDGLHLWMRGELPTGGRKSANVEMYDRARFFTVTGACLADAPHTLTNRPELLDELHHDVFALDKHEGTPSRPTVAAGQGPVLADQQIIDKAHRAKNAGKFIPLWNGDRSAYKSGSESDLALCAVLGFYTNDPNQLDRLFRQSGLMRDKWERPDYRDRTIGKVLGAAARPMWTPASERETLPGPTAPGDGGSNGGGAVPVGGAGSPSPAIRKVYRFTEFGNTDRLLDTHGQNMRFSKALGFVTWDGKRWRIDGELQVRAWAKQIVRDIFAEAAEAVAEAQRLAARGDDDGSNDQAKRAELLLEWARKSSTDHMVKAMVSLVKSDIEVDAGIFDAHPLLFNCGNGTIDLTTGQLRPHAQDDYLTQLSPIDYHPDATAPTFLRFLGEIMLDRAELVDYLQRAFGYSISGDVREQCWHLLVGEGANGKTTLIEAIERAIGDYAGTMEPESIIISNARRDAAAPSPDIAKLKGVRFVKITETEEGSRIAPARIKKLSGGDKLTARHLHKDIFEFESTSKIWLYTNHRPEARETTHAFWRRVRYVPFELNLRDHPERQDPELPAKLHDEAEGILAWLVAGCLRWQAEGLKAPALMTEAAESYRSDMDVLAAFIRDCCVLGKQYEARASSLYASYREWCDENGEREWKMRRFGQALTEKGVGTRKSHGEIIREGIGLRDPNSPDPEGYWWDDDKPQQSDGVGDERGPSDPLGGQFGGQLSPALSPEFNGTEDPSKSVGGQRGSDLGVKSRERAHSKSLSEIGPHHPHRPPNHPPTITLSGPGYSATPPDKDAPCSRGGKHMWGPAVGGVGFACRKCRPDIVNRPGR